MNFYKENIEGERIVLVLDEVKDADPVKEWVPAYYFSICDKEGNTMGICDLRIGHNERLYYGGNIGYAIYEDYRGHHYAVEAVRLLFSLARKHDLGYVMITCHPENIASKKTIEYAGCTYIETAELPLWHDLRKEDGHTHECIYRYDL